MIYIGLEIVSSAAHFSQGVVLPKPCALYPCLCLSAICLSVSLSLCVYGSIFRGYPILSFFYFFESRLLTSPELLRFCFPGWPVGPRNPAVSALPLLEFQVCFS